MLPLDSLPRNRAGKVDRRALPQPVSSPGSARAGAKGAGASNAYLAYLRRTDRLVSAVVLAPIAALAAVLLTGVLWPGSTDLRAVPQPWAGLFTGLYVAEWLAFGLGVAFLVFGRGLMPSRGRSPVLTTAAHLAIGWLLVAWWPQDNLYRLAAKDDWPQQAALVYGFNVTLIVAALIVAIHATRPATPSS